MKQSATVFCLTIVAAGAAYATQVHDGDYSSFHSLSAGRKSRIAWDLLVKKLQGKNEMNWLVEYLKLDLET